jgi:hypothetical protein
VKKDYFLSLCLSVGSVAFLVGLCVSSSSALATLTQPIFAQPSTNTLLPSSDNNNSSSYEFERGYPTNDTAVLAYDNADLSRAIEAYKFFYPTMINEAEMQVMPASDKPNQAGIKLSAGPRHLIFTANSDTLYAITSLDLQADGPMVVELPPGNFIGFVNDHNMRWVLDMGLNGPDKGHGGKHLILPPNYNGSVPEGYHFGQSETWKVIFAIRSVSNDGDTARALQALDTIKVYPLADIGGPVAFRFIDMTNSSLPNPILDWENNITYWQQLKSVVDAETSPMDFRPMYGMLKSLGIEKGKPFNPDARMTRILEEATKNAQAEMRVSAYANRDPSRITWSDRNWEWLPL